MNFRKQSLIIISFVMTVIFIIAIWFTYQIYIKETTHTDISPKQSATRQVEGLLSAAQKYPTGDVPHDDELYAYYVSVHPQCWHMLQNLMEQNANQYRLNVDRYYDSNNDPYPVHDYVEVDISVIFPDSHKVAMVYFQGGLSECAKVE